MGVQCSVHGEHWVPDPSESSIMEIFPVEAACSEQLVVVLPKEGLAIFRSYKQFQYP